MDVVYILGKGTNWKDNEIRYSLRSLAKHADKIDKVFIIGQCPDFLTGVIHYPHPDPHSCKELNIMEKIMRACELGEVSSNFFLVNDDHFFMQDFSLAKYPYYYSGTLSEYFEGANKFGRYTQAVGNTMKALSENKLSGKFFNVHHPIVINKSKFKKVMKQYDWNVLHGYVIKSLYCNTLAIEGEPIKDCKITRRVGLPEILKIIEGKPLFSTGDAFSQDMRDFLGKTFPSKSPWEK